MIADPLALLRLAVIANFCVGLSRAVADDLPCLARVNALGCAFTVAVIGLRAHTFSNYSMLSVPEAHATLCYSVNRDIALWVSELMRAAQRWSLAFVPLPAGTVLDLPTMPEVLPTLEFCRGGGGAPARDQQHRFRRGQAHQAEGHRSPRWVARAQGKCQYKSPPRKPYVRAHR